MRIPFANTTEKLRFYGVTSALVAAALLGLPILTYCITYDRVVSFAAGISAGYAKVVLARSDRISDAIQAGLRQLRDSAKTPCSASDIAELRSVAHQAVDIDIIARMSGNALVCSSFGPELDGLDLGPVNFEGMYRTRRDIHLPAVPNSAYSVVERDGWAFLFSKFQVTDVPTRNGLIVATFSTQARQVRTATGEIRGAWLARGTNEVNTFVDDGYIVAVALSSRYRSGAIAAFPISAFGPLIRRLEFTTVAVALIAGAAISAWILYLAREIRHVSYWSIRRSLRRNEFQMAYQPIVDMETGRWVGAEALMRWKRAEGVYIPADVFIAAAEQAGLIDRITKRMLRLVRQDAPAIFRSCDKFFVTINLAGQDLQDMEIVDDLHDLCDATGGVGRFKVEVTERSFLDEQAGREVIDAIRALGIETVVDDFGTGFSNLKYLTVFKFDQLKIDRSFVRGIDERSVAGAMASRIIGIAKSLGLGIVAEGVERQAQATALRRAGVRFGQGWLFSKALPAKVLVEELLLRRRSRGARAKAL